MTVFPSIHEDRRTYLTPLSHREVASHSALHMHHRHHTHGKGEMAIKHRLRALRHLDSATPSGGGTCSLTPSHHAAVYSHKTVP
jgi:hypothetical protein